MTDFVPELLAPAGSREAALAALSNGADAIYLGAASFGARVTAGFDAPALKEIIDLYHFHGRRVYVTVNTLVKECEMPGMRDTLRMLSDVRADAVLVQDMGVLSLIKEEFPHLCVHASTQMAIHNAAGARFLQSMGVSRAVLARECTLSAIRDVAATGIETEVFVHGAQCVCVSGQCRYSGLIGGRSGNRGRCAQPCRLPYSWQDKTAAWLSPRDMCLRDSLDQLTQSGVATLKIEGRLKRPEYVAVVTRAYRDALDAIAQNRYKKADKNEREALSQVFSRTFYPGYAFGARDNDVMNPARVSSAGIEIGRVTRVWKKGETLLCEVLLTKELHNGDGLQLRGAREQDVIYSGTNVPAGHAATLRLHHMAKSGDMVVRIDDEAQLAAARETFADKRLPRVSFDAQLTAYPGAPALLTVRDDRAEVTVSGDMVQTAQSAPLDEARARRALEKTGDTAYTLRNLSVQTADAYLAPAALNALRRDALEQLRTARIDAWRLPAGEKITFSPTMRPENTPALLFVQTTDAAAAQSLLSAGADRVVYAPLDITEPAFSRALDQLPAGAFVALPVQLTDDALMRMTAAVSARNLRLCVGSVGQIDLCAQRQNAPLLLSEGVPVWNARASKLLYQHGGTYQVLPRELSAREISDFSTQTDAQLILPVYGRARLMYLNHCPARTALGLRGIRNGCDLCSKGRGCMGQCLTDRKGEAFPLLPVRMEDGCLVQLLSCQVRSLKDSAPRMHYLLDFTIESAGQAADITRAYRALLDGKQADVPFVPERYDRGVE